MSEDVYVRKMTVYPAKPHVNDIEWPINLEKNDDNHWIGRTISRKPPYLMVKTMVFG